MFLFLPGTLPPAEAASTRDGIAVTSTGKVRKWKKLPVPLCVTSGLPAQVSVALVEAASTWNEGLGAKIFDTTCRAGTSDFEKVNTQEHSVFWVKSGFGRSGESLSLARTLSYFDEDSGEMLDADILLNAEEFDFERLTIDLKSVLIHELGHVLGLQHLFISQESVMNQYAYQSGIIRHRLGEYEVKSVKKLYLGSKQSVPAYLDTYFSGNAKLALELFRLRPKRGVEDYFTDGMLALSVNDPGSAVMAFRSALSLDPKSPLARYKLAVALIEMGKPEQAKSELEGVLRESPRYYEALADLGLILLQEGNTKEAIRLFRKILEVNPVHYPACIFLFKLTREPRYGQCVKKYAPDAERAGL